MVIAEINRENNIFITKTRYKNLFILKYEL